MTTASPGSYEASFKDGVGRSAAPGVIHLRYYKKSDIY